MQGPLPFDALVGQQSALGAAGPEAGSIALLSWIMFGAGALIFAVVMSLLAYALLAPQPLRFWLADRRTVIVGGIIFPVVALSALLFYGLSIARSIVSEPGEDLLEIGVVGEQFWWRVHYEADDAGPAFATANEIHIPIGRPVRFSLSTADVIHSFWVPSLGGKLDMIPGQVNSLILQAERPGVYRGQCTEFCGAAHALMAFTVVAHAEDAFGDWVTRQREPARQPRNAFLERGRDLFLQSGCGACHTISGTPANGTIGPDLTHVGGRRSIGAGILPNNQGTLAGWIAGNQHLKPNNKMPSFNVFSGRDLRAIAAYLESLK